MTISFTAVAARMLPADCQQVDALARRFAAGDMAAFREVVELHAPRLTSLVRRLLAWPDDVDDVVQDVFVAALKKRHSFRGDSQLSTWLAGIAVNQCRRHRRSLVRRVELLTRLWSCAQRTESRARKDWLLQDEQQQRVRQAVAALRDRDREVIVLRYLEEMRPPEIAHALSLSVNVVNVRLSRAREKLQSLLSGLDQS